MSYKGRWIEPSERTARDEYRALRKELKKSALTKSRRAEIESRLDELALNPEFTGTLQEKSIPGLPPASATSPDLPVLDVAPEAAREVPFVLSLSDRERSIQRALNATPAEKAEVILSELLDHPIQKLAREVAFWLWQEDKSSPKPDVDQMTRWKIKGWLAREPYNRSDISGNTETVANAVNDLFQRVAERDVAEPEWFVRRAEKLFDAQTVPTTAVPAEAIRTAEPLETSRTEASSEAARGNADLAARAALVLRTDGWLSRLAQHSDDMRARIIAALSDEILRVGHVSGDFAAKLYNDFRPRAVSGFPERKR